MKWRNLQIKLLVGERNLPMREEDSEHQTEKDGIEPRRACESRRTFLATRWREVAQDAPRPKEDVEALRAAVGGETYQVGNAVFVAGGCSQMLPKAQQALEIGFDWRPGAMRAEVSLSVHMREETGQRVGRLG